MSAVTLSESDTPVSDDARRSGVVGAFGPAGVIVTASDGLDALTLPAMSAKVAVTDHAPGIIVGMVHDVARPTT